MEVEEEEEEADLRIRGQNWSVDQKAEILQLWDDNEKCKPPEFVTKLKRKPFCRRMEVKYKRKLQPNKLRDWIKDRDTIMDSAKLQYSDRRKQSAPRESVGMFADMEIRLANIIRGMRQIGYVVESWMVDDEARHLLHQLYPHKYPKQNEDGTWPTDHPFKCR
jgi:hypothetical protein